MGNIRNFFSAAVVITVILYMINGLFAQADTYYPEFVLMAMPESLHKTVLWKSVFLENPNFWYLVGTLAAVVMGWKMKSIFF